MLKQANQCTGVRVIICCDREGISNIEASCKMAHLSLCVSPHHPESEMCAERSASGTITTKIHSRSVPRAAKMCSAARTHVPAVHAVSGDVSENGILFTKYCNSLVE
jgi:hypothetical protein